MRKEYEIQKQKEDEETRKRKEAELKASEELIKKLKAEEEYQQVLREEKIKLDEAIAKKLAQEFALNNSPSTSKINLSCKRYGPMDKFLKKRNETMKPHNNQSKKDIETITSLNQICLQDRNATNFAEKEYTCRILYLDNRKGEPESQKSFSPIIRKKIQQIQKIVETETSSDSSDCIESEMRYFKPINYKMAPPSQGISPIKVIPRRDCADLAAKIV